MQATLLVLYACSRENFSVSLRNPMRKNRELIISMESSLLSYATKRAFIFQVGGEKRRESFIEFFSTCFKIHTRVTRQPGGEKNFSPFIICRERGLINHCARPPFLYIQNSREYSCLYFVEKGGLFLSDTTNKAGFTLLKLVHRRLCIHNSTRWLFNLN